MVSAPNEPEAQLPRGWIPATIGDVGTYTNGFPFPSSDWGLEGRPIIRIQNLTRSSSSFNYTTRELDDVFVVEPGTILVSWSGTLDVFQWDGPSGLLNQHIFKVEPERRLVNKEFLYWGLKYAVAMIREGTALHGTTMSHITRSVFLSHPFPVPPIAEQRRIAERLSALNVRLKAVQAILLNLRKLTEDARSSVLGDSATGRLTASWRERHQPSEDGCALLDRLRGTRRRLWEEAELNSL
ncbi:MAG TPA: restriction endonuclease subunit S, partial [Candidatus Bathyarchaeia archaeon]